MPTSFDAPYKVRNRRFERLRNTVVRIRPRRDGKMWTSDGRGYQRDPETGVIRRIYEPAPKGALAQLRGLWRRLRLGGA